MKISVTKSKSGHYTVACRALDIKVRKISSLARARIVKAQIENGEQPGFGQ